MDMLVNHEKARYFINKTELPNQKYELYLIYYCITIFCQPGAFVHMLSFHFANLAHLFLNIWYNTNVFGKNVRLFL